jgi:hypothetical protein
VPEGSPDAAEPVRLVQAPLTPVDINDQLAAQIVLLGMQQVGDNARLSQNTLLAYQKDLFQGGQAELGSLLAALRGARGQVVVGE